MTRRSILGAALALLLALMVPLAGAGATDGGAYTLPTVDGVCESIFRIATIGEDDSVIALGTGFAIGDAQPIIYVATNYHVVSNYADNIIVWLNRDLYIKCTVIIALNECDIAVLQLDQSINRAPLPFGSSEDVSRGDQIYTFGFPEHAIGDETFLSAEPKDVTVTMGTISKKTQYNGADIYQIDATLNKGNSGGPLWHDKAGVIGINTIKSTITDNMNGSYFIENLITALDAGGIKYLRTKDLLAQSQEPSGTSTAAPTATPEPTATVDPTASAVATPPQESSKILLILGIALAGLAILLLALALYLRMRDVKRAQDDLDRTPASDSGGQEIPQPVERSLPPKKQPEQKIELKPIALDEKEADKKVDGQQLTEQEIMESATKRISKDQEEDLLATRRLSQPMRAVVRSLGGFFSGAVVPVGAQLLIGRDTASCQLVYPMEMTQISRRHVAIAYSEGSGLFEVTDLSTNGTFRSDGTRLKKGELATFKPGEQFYVSGKEELFCVDLEAV